MGDKRQFKHPCGKEVEEHLWKRGGFSYNCKPSKQKVEIRQSGATWEDVEDARKTFWDMCCSTCKERGVA